MFYENYRQTLVKKAAQEMSAVPITANDVSEMYTAKSHVISDICTYYRQMANQRSFRDVYRIEEARTSDLQLIEEYFNKLFADIKAQFTETPDATLYLMENTDTKIVGQSMPAIFRVELQDIPESSGKCFVMEEDLKTISIIETNDKLQDVRFVNIQNEEEEYWYDGTQYLPRISTQYEVQGKRSNWWEVRKATSVALQNMKRRNEGLPLLTDWLDYENDSTIAANVQLSLDKHQEYISHVELHPCKDCGGYWTLYAEEKEWYIQKGFSIPKRCPECRDKRKRMKEEDE